MTFTKKELLTIRMALGYAREWVATLYDANTCTKDGNVLRRIKRDWRQITQLQEKMREERCTKKLKR